MSADHSQGDGPADHGACQSAADGTVSGAPRAWLRAEAAALLAGALAAYSFQHTHLGILGRKKEAS